MPLAVQLHPAMTIAPAIAVMLGLAWYWIRLGQAKEPVWRRRLRRISIGIIMLALPVLMHALRLNHAAQPREYLFTWTLVLALALLVIFVAVVDLIGTLHHARIEADRGSDR